MGVSWIKASYDALVQVQSLFNMGERISFVVMNLDTVKPV